MTVFMVVTCVLCQVFGALIVRGAWISFCAGRKGPQARVLTGLSEAFPQSHCGMLNPVYHGLLARGRAFFSGGRR